MGMKRNTRQGKTPFTLPFFRKKRHHAAPAVKKTARRRSRKGNPLLAGLIAAGVVVALAAGGFVLSQRSGSKPVNVYEIRDDFAMTDYWGDGSQTDGMVGLEGIQPVYLTDTMVVKDVVVSEGQSVHKGDKLLNYDTTLTQLDVQLKEVKVRQAELELTNAQKELAKVQSYRAGELIAPGTSDIAPMEPEEEETESTFEDDGTLKLEGGTGTYADPFTYQWKVGYSFDEAFLEQAMRGKDDCYVLFLMKGESSAAEHVHIPDQEDWYRDEQGHYRICGVCGQEYDRQEHNFLTVVDQYPDVGVEGSQHEVCGICGFVGQSSAIPALEAPEIPTQAPTEAPTEPTSEEPSEPESEDPTEPPTEDPGDLPTQLPEEESTEESISNPTPAEQAKVQAKVLMQFQNTSMGRNFQIISIDIPSGDAAVTAPLFQWRGGLPLPEATEEPTEAPVPTEEPEGIRYTSEQLQQMRLDAQARVRDLDLALRQTRLDYEKAERELSNSAVYAQIDGKVRNIIDQNEAKDSGSPLLNVTAGGGYYIQCSLSELERDVVKPGQKVTVNSWSSGSELEGVITQISDFPTTGNNWGSGNTNVSYYPFTVFVDEQAELQEGDYVSVQYSASGGNAGFYLQSMFIRSENGRSYVYVDNNGRLEKRFISTGQNLWGSYTQVFSGITPDDRLAFPYGKDVKDGAATVVASADTLYGY